MNPFAGKRLNILLATSLLILGLQLTACEEAKELFGLGGESASADKSTDKSAPAPKAAPKAAPIVAPAAAPAAVAPEKAAEAPAPKDEGHPRAEYVAAYAEIECALATKDGLFEKARTKAALLAKHKYSATAYQADIEKYGTVESDLEKAKCMPKTGKTAAEFATVFAEMACAFARADEADYERIAIELLTKHDYPAEHFAEDQDKFGLEDGEKLAEACMPEIKGRTREGLIELSVKLNCSNRSKLTSTEKQEYKTALLGEYGLSEDDYHAERTRMKTDAAFKKALTDGLKACPRVADEKKTISKSQKKKTSAFRGKWRARLKSRGSNGGAVFTVGARRVSSAMIEIDKNRLSVTHKRLTGNRIFIEGANGADSVRMNGSFAKGTWKGTFRGHIKGRVIQGHWTAARD